MKYDDHEKVLKMLAACQEAEDDLRDAAREAHLFVDKRDGQWEPYWWTACDNKPRYTFDFTNPVVTQLAGSIRRKDFDAKISPASGPTSQQDALLFDGLVRTIQAHSQAKYIYNTAAKNMVISGLDGWMIVQEYCDNDSFDQELRIKPIANFVDSVWFDVGSKDQTRRDAKYCFVLEAIPKEDYEEEWPERNGTSVDMGLKANAYYDKAEQVIIGQIYYVKVKTRTLVKLSSGRVVVDDEDFRAVKDFLAAEGEEVVDTRSREERSVWVRKFDGDGWLDDEEETVFEYIPVVPVYGNFKIFENKTLFRGAVEKLMDPQRVYNYAKSREIEEGALAPRAKYWMTPKQASGFESTLQTLNTNADPVQFYNPDPEAEGPPQQMGGASINEGLVTLSQSMAEVMDRAGGIVDVARGDNPGLQSGVAIEKLQDKSDVPSLEYQEALELAIGHTGTILVKAIPRVYSEERQIMLMGQDGAVEPVTINQIVADPETGVQYVLNDVSKGSYTVVGRAGPSFTNRQQETVSAITEVAAVNPAILEIGSDILFKNMTSPGMDQIAARARLQLFNAGLIPQDQMTEEELQQYQAAQEQEPPPDPAMILAQAEAGKAQAQTEKVQVDAQVASARLQLDQQEQQSNAQLRAQELSLRDMELRLREQDQQLRAMIELQRTSSEQQKTMVDLLNTQAMTLKILREAIGAEAVLDPTAMRAYSRQAEEVLDAQRPKPNGSGILPAPT